MKRPSDWQILIGNPISLILIMAIGLGLIWGYFTGSVNGWISILALILMANGVQAGERYAKFKAWERDWSETGARATRRGPPFQGWRFVLGGLAWIGLACLAASPSQPGSIEEVASLLFWFASGLIGLVALWRLLHGRRTSASSDVVSICVTRQSAGSDSLATAYASLPEQYKAILHSKAP